MSEHVCHLYRIRAEMLPSLQEKLEKLNRKAVKVGVEPAKIHVRFEQVEHRIPRSHAHLRHILPDHEIPKVAIRYLHIGVEGQRPKFEGWDFIATVEHTEAGNILRKAPGASEECPLHFRESKPVCDHCKVQRYRKNTYIVKHDSGEWKQVGRQCIRDFLGHADPKEIAAVMSFWESLEGACGEADHDDDYERGRWGAEPCYEPQFIAQVAAAIIRKCGGYVSKKLADMDESRQSTAMAIREYLSPCPADPYAARMWREMRERFKPEEQDVEFGRQAIAHVRAEIGGKAASERSDFEHNLLVSVSQEWAGHRDIGILAYVVEHYRRHLSIEAEKRSPKANEHIGEVGARLDLELVVAKVINLGFSQFGERCMILFRDAAGNMFKWATDASRADEMELDKAVKIRGTVKKHDDYKGRKQTVLTRCKVL